MIDWREEFDKAVKANKKIDAVKAYREWKNVGLKEAALYVQANWADLRLLRY